MSNASIKIANRLVGKQHPCFFIAEIGSNHNNDMDMAKKLIDLAAEAKVDAVKFQTFRAKTLYSKHTPSFNYSDAVANKSIHDIIASLELDWEWHAPLKEYAEKAGLVFMTSPFDCESVDLMAKIGLDAYKVASFELPDTELISYVAKQGKPIILSTGLANMADIERGVTACRAAGNEDIVVLQCTSMYPAPAHLCNLRVMETIANSFNVIPGYSDHTTGDHTLLAAVTLGAKVIEKHYTLDRSLLGPDHAFAMNPQELKETMIKLRETEAALGDGLKNGPRPEENVEMVRARRSIHVKRNIKAGEIIREEDIIIKRPNMGIEPHLKHVVVGRPAKQDILEDHWVSWDMI